MDKKKLAYYGGKKEVTFRHPHWKWPPQSSSKTKSIINYYKDGELKNVVKNPNYRGITQDFWHNLIKVGNDSTRNILGTANCGKGEPNQSIFVGHSTPSCLFKDVEIFGGLS